MKREELREEIEKIIARECSMYTEQPIGAERCVGAANRILSLIENEVKQPTEKVSKQ
jgi:hypothetical protein